MKVTLPYPRSPGEVLSWGQKLVATLNRALSDLGTVLPGTTTAYPGATAPAGWLEMDGTVVLRADYENLFRIVGTDFNTGGETGVQFRLPNWSAPGTGGIWIIKT